MSCNKYGFTAGEINKDTYFLEECPIFNDRCRRAERSFLTKYQSIRTEEKPFSCQICGKRFTRFSFLTKHQRIHTGSKLHVCKICGKRFIYFNSLTKHQCIRTRPLHNNKRI